MNAVLWTSEDADAATGGQSTHPWTATGLSIDSRSIAAGELFVALKDQRDGHDFVADALARGAAAALVERRPDDVPDDAPLLKVSDVLPALEAMAAAARTRAQAQVIAVTGSVGKTTTKEMLRAALAPQGLVHAAEKSFNNHWGVPLTLARCPAAAEFAVIEIGMNHPGEIEPLARLSRPNVAVVTIVAAAHLEAFDSLEGIAREKGTIFAGLEPGGCAILNGDLDVTQVLRAAASSAARCVGFGAGPDCDARLTDLVPVDDGSSFRAEIGGTVHEVRLNAPGRHLAMNALAVLAAVDAAGGNVGAAISALADWRPFTGRGTRERIKLDSAHDQAFDLIDDAYNANPTSIGAALDVLADINARGRRVVILGDMLELGPTGPALHAGIADHPAMDRIDVVHCVGPLMQSLRGALPERLRGEGATSVDDLILRLRDLVQPDDTVLVKGSLGSRLGRAVDALRQMPNNSPMSSQGHT